MATPRANKKQVTRKSKTKPKMGRPTKLTPHIIKKAWSYLDAAKDNHEIVGENRPTVIWNVNLPTIEGLANFLDISRDTLYQWEKENQDFSDILTRVKSNQAERLINNALAGNYNPMISKLLLSKHGYIEKQEQDVNLNGQVQFVNDVPRPKSN